MARGYRYAFSLSKEQLRSERPPGTVVLVSHDLERTTTGTQQTVDHIKLVPTPTDDPADPLTWPLWRKIGILWATSFYSFANNYVSASLAPALPLFSVALNTPLSQLAQLVAVSTLMAGAANLWWVPLANVYGRRPISLICTLIMTFTTLWCGYANSFNNLLAARIFQGIGIAAADAVTPDVVGEIFYVHQRGRAMAVYTVFLIMGSLAGGTSGSYIAAAYGIRYIFWIGTAMSGACFIFIFFLQPETLFGRSAPAETLVAQEQSAGDGPPLSENKRAEAGTHVEESPSYRPYTYAWSLRFWGINRGGLMQAFVGPWRSLLFPGTWLVMLHYGGLVGGIVCMATVGPTLLSEPPYSWGQNVGLFGIGGIIGAIIGAIYTYLVVDRRLKQMASHAVDGHVEPESRLPLLAPSLVISTAGILMFGFLAQSHTPKAWIGFEFGYGMMAFGLMSVPSVDFNYIIDSYNAISGDCFVMIVASRSAISFAWTFFVGDWIASRGDAEPFGIFGMLLGLFALLTVLQYFYGKRTRIATARWLPKRADH